MTYELKDYREVPERIAEWYARHPDGRIVCEIVEFTDDRVTVKASAYRAQGEEPAGVGHSFLTLPGKTPYTRDSELENAETSAAGRALVMAGIPAKSVASEGEVRSKQGVDAAPKVASTVAGDDGPEPSQGLGEGPQDVEGPRPPAAISIETKAALTATYGSAAKAKAAAQAAFGDDLGSIRDLTEDQGRELLNAKVAVA